MGCPYFVEAAQQLKLNSMVVAANHGVMYFKLHASFLDWASLLRIFSMDFIYIWPSLSLKLVNCRCTLTRLAFLYAYESSLATALLRICWHAHLSHEILGLDVLLNFFYLLQQVNYGCLHSYRMFGLVRKVI